MLELRPGCECCDRDLPPDSVEARICSFECTFCVGCAEGVVRRPIRPAEKLVRFPASTVRKVKPQGCVAVAVA
jgi:hypothetical protein